MFLPVGDGDGFYRGAQCSDFGVHIVFKDSAGVTLETVTRVATINGAHELGVRATIPTGAVTARVSNGAVNGSSPSAAAVVGWYPGIPKVPTHKVNTGPFPQTCQGWSGSCDCSISCEEDEILVDYCLEYGPPACTRNAQCYCAPMEGPAEYMGADGWL